MFEMDVSSFYIESKRHLIPKMKRSRDVFSKSLKKVGGQDDSLP